eukprot:gene28500-37453_t
MMLFFVVPRLLFIACGHIYVLSYLSNYKSLKLASYRVSVKPYFKLSLSNDDKADLNLQEERTSKGTQENEIRANLRANIEVVANRSRYTSTDYFPDNNEISQDILTSLKSTRSYFSILVERFAQSIDDFQVADSAKKAAYVLNSGYFQPPSASLGKKERIVVLGSGWGSHSFLKRANVPNLNEEEIRDALSFVVVGAGPTGVEFTSELRDWIENEGRRYYGKLLKYVKITLVEAGNAVLAVFDEALQKEAMRKLTERRTQLVSDGYIPVEVTQVLLRSGVKVVGDKYIEFSNGERLNYGFCVWAAGNGPIPFVLNTIEKVDYQKADTPLPATAQGFKLRATTSTPPYREAKEALASISTSEGESSVRGEPINFFSDIAGLGQLGVPSTAQDGSLVEFAKPFQFLNLGVLAYIGASEALAQISVDKSTIKGSGNQVSWRSRVSVSLDWIKAKLFGRDLGALY